MTKLIKTLARLEKRYESINSKCKVTRARVLRKAMSIQRKIEKLTD
jgi:hypothetical protein